MTGLAAPLDSTLVDRALGAMAEGARPADWLAQNILGLMNAPSIVAERLAAALLGADPRAHRLADGRWSLVTAAYGAPLIEDCAFAVIDTETTGVRAGRDDRITEIAVVLVHGERREMIFESLVNPGKPIPKIVTSVTGITDQMVRAAPRFEEIAEKLLDVLSGRVFVAHNARFDWRFVAAELRQTRGVRLEGPRLCTVRLARRLVGTGVLQSCGLDALTYYFGFRNTARHRAGGDAMVTAQLLQRLMGLARDTGARTLPELEMLQGPQRRQKKRRGTRGPATPQPGSWDVSPHL